jgi:2-dehydropantoate 2-reductase
MQAVVDEFRQAGIETGLVEYHEARWKKAVWNYCCPLKVEKL